MRGSAGSIRSRTISSTSSVGTSRLAVMRVAMYARVSRLDQEPDNQLHELRRYVAARGWEAVAFVEHGVSGAKDRRPVLDQLLADVRRRRTSNLTRPGPTVRPWRTLPLRL